MQKIPVGNYFLLNNTLDNTRIQLIEKKVISNVFTHGNNVLKPAHKKRNSNKKNICNFATGKTTNDLMYKVVSCVINSVFP